MPKPLALTSGEPAGIGPDIAIKAWLRRDELKLPAFYLLGDPNALGERAKKLGMSVRMAKVRPEEAVDAFAKAFPPILDQLVADISNYTNTRPHHSNQRS